jgi:hypothetical protein
MEGEVSMNHLASVVREVSNVEDHIASTILKVCIPFSPL